jgi:hypothetical protein
MAELTRSEINGGDSRSGELKELIDHWVEVLDDWVERLDQGMGGMALGADPAQACQPPDPSPGPLVPPALETA